MAMADKSFGFIHIRYGDGRTGFKLSYCDFSVFFFFPFSLINSGFLSNHSPGRTFPIITDKEKTDFLSTDTFLSFQCSPIRTKFVSKIKEIQCRVPPICNKSCVMMSVISSNIKLRETPMAGKFGVVVTFLTQSHIFICD